jgi:hypothetical protein
MLRWRKNTYKILKITQVLLQKQQHQKINTNFNKIHKKTSNKNHN